MPEDPIGPEVRVYNMIVTLRCAMCNEICRMPNPYEDVGGPLVASAIFHAYQQHKKKGCQYSENGMRKI